MQLRDVCSEARQVPLRFTVSVNPLPDDKILDWSKLKQIADILKCI